MSSKIDIREIIKGHFKSLRGGNSDSINKADIFTFYIIPALISALGIWNDFELNNDLRSLLINFGSIFTALLLSVLVLIVDQETKLDDKKNLLDQQNLQNDSSLTVPYYSEKKKILQELYHNICYCIVSSMILIIATLIDSVFKDIPSKKITTWIEFDLNTDVFSPFCIFIALNIILSNFMIVKRMHALLTIQYE